MKSRIVVNKRFTKGKGEYKKIIDEIQSHGNCPFCLGNFRYHKKPVLKKIGTWFLTENSWPYKNASRHFLIINTEHKESLEELSVKDFEYLRKISLWAIRNFNLKGGALTMRFGDTNYTGATVCHIHAHIIYPKVGKDKKSKTVIFPIG